MKQETLFKTKTCPRCKGTGKEWRYVLGEKVQWDCGLCFGTGKV